MLTLENITREFKNNKHVVTALKGISLTVKQGDMISIMGPSGSGKSTLMYIIGCLDIPTSGMYRIGPKDVNRLSDKERATLRNKKFGFVLQQFALIEEETVMENVSMPLIFGDTSLFQVDVEVTKMLELLNIEALAGKKVKYLSGGEKQRTAIARALINKPDVILADEPTGSLDGENTKMIMELMQEWNQKGKTVIIITHDPVVANACPIRYTMMDGRLKYISEEEDI